jgi:predicted Zn-dependent peptidase
MVLCIVGDVDEESVCKLVTEQTPSEKRPVPERDYGEKETVHCNCKRFEKTMSVSMPTFAIGFKCEEAGSGEELMRAEIVGDIAAEILCGESSALYTELYESGLIDADFSAGYESVKGACLLSANGDSCDPEAVYAAIVKEAKRIAEEGFDKAQFDRLLKSALGRRTRDLDSFESVSYRNCAYHFDGVDYYRFPEIYASVTPQAVQEFIARVVRDERGVMAVIRPKGDA